MTFTHQNLIANWLTYLVHAKSTGELISFGFGDHSAGSLVSANYSAKTTSLWSQSEFRTERKSRRKTNHKFTWNDPMYIQYVCIQCLCNYTTLVYFGEHILHLPFALVTDNIGELNMVKKTWMSTILRLKQISHLTLVLTVTVIQSSKN